MGPEGAAPASLGGEEVPGAPHGKASDICPREGSVGAPRGGQISERSC